MVEKLELYRCTECGFVCRAEPEGAIGTFHAHVDKHTPWYAIGDFDRYMQYTERLTVTVEVAIHHKF